MHRLEAKRKLEAMSKALSDVRVRKFDVISFQTGIIQLHAQEKNIDLLLDFDLFLDSKVENYLFFEFVIDEYNDIKILFLLTGDEVKYLENKGFKYKIGKGVEKIS